MVEVTSREHSNEMSADLGSALNEPSKQLGMDSLSDIKDSKFQ